MQVYATPRMADSSDSVSSWPGFVGQLNKTFMLVRDAFGYALPGGVFLTIGLICQSYNLSELKSLLSPYTLPSWAAFIAVVAACYTAGALMAATAYMPIGVAKYIVWMLDRHVQHVDKPTEGSLRDWLINNPTEVTSEILQIRVQHVEILNTLDRRETLNLMAGSMAAALLTGWYVFCYAHWSLSRILVWGGLITVLQFLTGLSHLRRVAKAVRSANLAAPTPDPNLPKLLGDLITAATAVLNKLAR